MSCTFTNDNDTTVTLINHPFTPQFRNRDHHEVLFRRINTFLILRGIINRNIIDLGAWIGDNTIPWAKNIQGTVYAIDPSQDNCEFIRATAAANNLSNVKIVQTAISDHNELLSTNDDLTHCSFVYGNTGQTGTNKVHAVSLDYLFATGTIENIGYIHLDVEGMEYKVLIGSSSIIDTNRPVITFEQHLETDDYGAILCYLSQKKYTVFLIDEVLPGCRPDCRNSIAFPTEQYTDQLLLEMNAYIGRPILLPKKLIL